MSDDTLHPWQQSLTDLLSKVSPGTPLISAGRKLGKSQLSTAAFKRLMDDIHNGIPLQELVLSEGTIYGSTYYCIEPVHGNWPEMEAWAIQTYGESADVWNLKEETYIWPELGRWYMNNRRFWFRDIKDRDWFIMRWNS